MIIAGFITKDYRIIKIKDAGKLIVIEQVQEAAAANGSIPKEKLN